MSLVSYSPIYNGNPKSFGRVAVLYGGTSAERSVSLKSGQAVLKALQDSGVDVVGIDVGEDICAQLAQEQFDRAFIALHGGDGEGGKVQALLALMNIPFTGSDHAASALALNKLHTKQIWLTHKLPTASYLMVEQNADLDEVWQTLGPMFVKPTKEGSSYGISPARNRSELDAAVSLAREFEATVLAESLIDGSEFSVSILGEQALSPIEIINHAEFYDFEAKYESNETEYICPAKVSEAQTQMLQRYALQAFEVLGCEGWGRVDFMRNQQGEFFLLEVNTVPGMTDHSLVPMAAKSAGLSYEQLVLEVLALSVQEVSVKESACG